MARVACFPNAIALVPACVAVLVFAPACASDRGIAANGDTPWTTAVDSTGDTIVVRITGEVPRALVHSLVPELTVGSLDGSVEETFGSISTITGLPDGGMLVFDNQAGEVRRFDSTGAFVHTLGGKGGGPGEYGHVNGMQILPDGRIALWDAAGNRLNVYAAGGAFLTSWRLPVIGQYASNILHSDSAGNLYLRATLERQRDGAVRDRSGLIRLDSMGAVVDSVKFPLWRTGEQPLLTARSADGGSSMTWSMPFVPDVASALTKSGGVVSGPQDPYVFYLLPRGANDVAALRPVRVEQEHEPVPVADEEASFRRTMITARMRGVNPEWTWTGADIPATKPAYREIFVGRDGRIWVSISTAAVPIPEEELAALDPNDPNGTRPTTREPVVFDVYSPEGLLLGRVAAPPLSQILDTDGPHAWGVQRDSLDVPYAVRFRIEPALPRD